MTISTRFQVLRTAAHAIPDDIHTEQRIFNRWIQGRLSFLQNMLEKVTKWEIEAWVLADSVTGYVWNWRLYCGKEENVQRGARPLKHIVLDLLSDFQPIF